jgi:hypothetical protein
LSHASNMGASLYGSCVFGLVRARERESTVPQSSVNELGVADIGARQPTNAEHVTY